MSEDYKPGEFEDGSILSAETASVDGVLIWSGFFLLSLFFSYAKFGLEEGAAVLQNLYGIT